MAPIFQFFKKFTLLIEIYVLWLNLVSSSTVLSSWKLVEKNQNFSQTLQEVIPLSSEFFLWAISSCIAALDFHPITLQWDWWSPSVVFLKFQMQERLNVGICHSNFQEGKERGRYKWCVQANLIVILGTVIGERFGVGIPWKLVKRQVGTWAWRVTVQGWADNLRQEDSTTLRGYLGTQAGRCLCHSQHKAPISEVKEMILLSYFPFHEKRERVEPFFTQSPQHTDKVDLLSEFACSRWPRGFVFPWPPVGS